MLLLGLLFPNVQKGGLEVYTGIQYTQKDEDLTTSEYCLGGCLAGGCVGATTGLSASFTYTLFEGDQSDFRTASFIWLSSCITGAMCGAIGGVYVSLDKQEDKKRNYWPRKEKL